MWNLKIIVESTTGNLRKRKDKIADHCTDNKTWRRRASSIVLYHTWTFKVLLIICILQVMLNIIQCNNLLEVFKIIFYVQLFGLT